MGFAIMYTLWALIVCLIIDMMRRTGEIFFFFFFFIALLDLSDRFYSLSLLYGISIILAI